MRMVNEVFACLLSNDSHHRLAYTMRMLDMQAPICPVQTTDRVDEHVPSPYPGQKLSVSFPSPRFNVNS